ncbi:MAG: response regulator [Bacteroidota bacterium]
MKILIVDDEKDVQRLFEQRFRRERKKGQVELFFAFSGREAVDFLEQGGEELTMILSDINMPNMDGLELLEFVRSKFTKLKVFMITAYGDESNKKRAIDLGANDYLMKPINFKHLKEKIF